MCVYKNNKCSIFTEGINRYCMTLHLVSFCKPKKIGLLAAALPS